MARPKRARVDSISRTVSLLRDTQLGPLAPPSYVRIRECDKPHWDAIMGTRQRSQWSPPDLALAARLARACADIERLHAEVEMEGECVLNEKGTEQVLNPKFRALEVLERRALAISRSLHVDTFSAAGESQHSAKQKQAMTDAARISDALGDDGLIPGLDSMQ